MARLLYHLFEAPFLGPESGPCFGATKHKQELVNAGSKCATADASWQQHISVSFAAKPIRGYMPEALALPLIWGSGFGALGPPRLWEEAPLHVKPASWHQAQENMNGRCNLSQLLQRQNAYTMHMAANFSIVAPFLGPEWQTGATNRNGLDVKPASWHQAQENIMEDACRSSTRSLQKAKRIHHGPKIGTTHLEAGLLILVLWPHFWVQNLAPVLGPQNTNRS